MDADDWNLTCWNRRRNFSSIHETVAFCTQMRALAQLIRLFSFLFCGFVSKLVYQLFINPLSIRGTWREREWWETQREREALCCAPENEELKLTVRVLWWCYYWLKTHQAPNMILAIRISQDFCKKGDRKRAIDQLRWSGTEWLNSHSSGLWCNKNSSLKQWILMRQDKAMFHSIHEILEE